MSTSSTRRQRPRRMYTAKYRARPNTNRLLWAVVALLAVGFAVLIGRWGW
ncbi:hypothetical protein [Hymenobacter sp. CRA2]|nr:hypothetical protein [Hymenobacter sp. CRA2]